MCRGSGSLATGISEASASLCSPCLFFSLLHLAVSKWPEQPHLLWIIGRPFNPRRLFSKLRGPVPLLVELPHEVWGLALLLVRPSLPHTTLPFLSFRCWPETENSEVPEENFEFKKILVFAHYFKWPNFLKKKFSRPSPPPKSSFSLPSNFVFHRSQVLPFLYRSACQYEVECTRRLTSIFLWCCLSLANSEFLETVILTRGIDPLPVAAPEPYFRKGKSFQTSAHRQSVGSELLTGNALLRIVFSVRTVILNEGVLHLHLPIGWCLLIMLTIWPRLLATCD